MQASPVLPSVSRPKIHRLPVVQKPERVPRPARVSPGYDAKSKKVFVIGGALLCAAFAVLLVDKMLPVALSKNIVPSTTATGPATASGEETIVLRNENQVIIGQMAHISSPVTSSSEVSTMSNEADRRKGQELLSIINQY